MRALAVVVAAAIAIAGCTTSRSVSPAAFATLDGYVAGPPPAGRRTVIDTRGRPVPFDDRSKLRLRYATKVSPLLRPTALTFRDGAVVVATAGQPPVTYPLSGLASVEIHNLSAGLTALAFFGGLAAAGVFGLWLAFVNDPQPIGF